MAELLYRLGRFSARRAWAVVFAWIGVLVLAGGAFLIGFGSLSSNFDVPDTASSRVIDELQDALPEYSGASGLVVLHVEDGKRFTADQRELIGELVRNARTLDGVATVTDPFETEQERTLRGAELADGLAQLEAARAAAASGQLQLDPAAAREAAAQAELLQSSAELMELSDGVRLVSQDGATALVNVTFDKPRMQLSEEAKQGVIAHFESAGIAGVEVALSTEIYQGMPQILGVSEVLGVLIAAIVLIVMLGTVVAAALPLVTAIAGVAVGVLFSLSLSGAVQMVSVTPVLGVMLGLAVGIDYALFIVNRHRKQLREGAELSESIALASGTAGNAVLFAGSTVIVALLALNITGISFLGVMGNVAAVCVAIAVLIALTMLPALEQLVGMRILKRRGRRVRRRRAELAPVRPMGWVRAVATIVAVVAALGALAIPASAMRLGLPDGSSEPAGSSSHRAFELTEQAFGAGTNGALLVTAELPAGTAQGDVLATQLTVARSIMTFDDVVAVAPIAVSSDNRLAAFQVIPGDGPNSESTEQLVRDLRSLAPLGESELGVAGQAAINIDISESLENSLPIYLTVVVGLSLLIMIVVFRSLLVPLIATGGFILSLLATFGAVTAVFQWGWLGEVFGVSAPGPILSFLPVILVGILFGLAMDYQLFLATGMREAYAHGASARLAVAQGFRGGRSVVIAAGLIMVSVFGGFIFAESNMIRSLGFGLAFGVLVDAFLVRMLLMPAIMHLLGSAAWWLPAWLDRLLPNVDVEGAALERKHHAVTPA